MTLLLLLSLPARALDADTFQAAGSGLDRGEGLQILSPSLGDPGAAYGGLVLVYAHAPITRSDQFGNTEDVVDGSFGMHLMGGYTIGKSVRLDLAVPIYPYVGTADGSAALGDIRVAALFPLIDGKVSVGLQPNVSLPSGNADAYVGSGSIGAGLRAAIGYRPSNRSFLAANLGVLGTNDSKLGDLTLGSQASFGVGAGVHVSDTVTLGAELDSAITLAAGVGPYNKNPVELHGYTIYHAPSGLVLDAGIGTGLVRGIGAPDVRVIGGIGYSRPGVPPVIDTDGDGMMDDVDACVQTKETVNGWKDTDGCPDALGTLSVLATRDGQPIEGAEIFLNGASTALRLDAGDSATVPNVMPGSTWSGTARAGQCLAGQANVTAGEGVTRLQIALLPELKSSLDFVVTDGAGQPVPEAAVKVAEGPPGCAPSRQPTLTGGRGTAAVGAGTYALQVTAPGYAPWTGEAAVDAGARKTVEVKLVAARVRVEIGRIVILDKVFFETAKAIIKPESFPLLDEVAATLRTNPQILKVEVGGHTDSDGNDAANQKLSQARAEAVLDYLAVKGKVDASRLVAKGYGETTPISTNKTSAGKATNRRVEFLILEPVTK